MKIKGGRIFTCHALHDKQKRSLAVLELIRKKGAMSRTDISRATGINVVSISNYINNFVDENILLEKGRAESSGGRKPELIELNAKEHYCIGVDLCQAGFSIALTDIASNIISKNKIDASEGRRDVPESVIGLIRNTVASSGISIDKVRAIGLGVCDEALLGVRDAVEKEFGIESFIGGEAACAAFAERRHNPLADTGKLLYIHSDLGRAIMIDGDDCIGCIGGPVESAEPVPHEGADGTPGEDEKLRYLSPWGESLGIVRMAKREVSRGVGTKIVSVSGGDVNRITQAVVIEAARKDDETALNILQSVSVTLGLRIAYLVNLFAPQVVVIGGGPEMAADITFPAVTKMVRRLSIKVYSDKVKVVAASTGDQALSLGAAELAVREVFLKA